MKWIRRTRKKEKERDDRLRELMIKSDYLIYKKKLFLKLDFSKQDLASELGTNRTYLGEANGMSISIHSDYVISWKRCV